MELGTVLAESRGNVKPLGGHVMQEAERLGWIRPFSQGQYLYAPQWVNLLRTLQEFIRLRAVEHLGFQEWLFPRMIPREALDSFKLTQFAPDLLVATNGSSKGFLDPVQCVSLYHALRHQVLERGMLPLKVVECLGGWTWRNESEQTLDGPYRAKEFLRVEHVYIGTPSQVTSIREAVRNGLLELLNELGVAWQVVVGAGCMDIPSIKARQSQAQEPNEIPVQDIEVPIRGALRHDTRRDGLASKSHAVYTESGLIERPNNEFYLDTDEICGSSVEGDHLLSSFDITCADGEEIWSGCTGMGLNRLVVAFLYQHGFDSATWPECIGAPKSAVTPMKLAQQAHRYDSIAS
jgi:seryl-tRNA synthetase